ncbi:phage major capsid protein [Nocardioides yefusunii]|uniref:Phage major capsid protein n=1 Tax=Nocardioides yefusunii TaxID=2500546 RepID=A0ABW1QWV3_9ACTN|nr:phage major capsid protein [Nocardioides yefusunii]
MTLHELITRKRSALASLLNERATNVHELAQIAERGTAAPSDEARVAQLRQRQGQIDSEARGIERTIADLEAAAADDALATARAEVRVPASPSPSLASGAGAPAELGTRGAWINTDTGAPAALRSGETLTQRVAQFAPTRQDSAVMSAHENVGSFVRALATSGGGAAVVPTSWSATIIDQARSLSALGQAGATLIPMETKTVEIGRLLSDPTSGFRTEGSTITASDPTFDNVTLTAKTASALTVASLEWFDDSQEGQQLIEQAISQSIANTIDVAGLYGGITTGAGAINLATPPNPRGVLAALNANRPANVLGTAAANGTTQTAATFWSEIIDLLFTVQDGNETPTGLLWNSKVARQYAKATATDGQPLQVPDAVKAVPSFVTNQIPSYTKGTMTTATDVFAGNWSQLLIGQRLGGIKIQILTERYAENGQVGIVAHWRGDIQPARSSAFSVHRALLGA